MTKIASVNYDLFEQYQAEVQPLVEQLHAKLIELGIPFYFVACHKNNDESFAVAQAAHLKKGITPVQLFAAELCGDNRANPMAMHMLFATQDTSEE